MSEDYSAWIGRSTTAQDTLEPGRSNALLVALGRVGAGRAGDRLPLLHHWLYFWDVRPPAGLGADGHPAKGGFLPPIDLPRRMWAGGRLEFQRPLLLGQQVEKTSTILSVARKEGRSGELIFVTVEHQLTGTEGVAIREEQDLVYRETADRAPELPHPVARPQAEWAETVEPDPVMLFRYSALTMNGHRIHYDRPYATGEESYPALVVHGPLQATLLIALAERHLDRPIARFEFRGQAPAFDSIPLHVCGERSEAGASLWTQQGEAVAMSASVQAS